MTRYLYCGNLYFSIKDEDFDTWIEYESLHKRIGNLKYLQSIKSINISNIKNIK